MPHTFSLDMGQDPAVLLEKARRLITEDGGSLIGDTRAGQFAAEGVQGAYEVAGQTITIVLTEKPWLASWSLIESKVRELFS